MPIVKTSCFCIKCLHLNGVNCFYQKVIREKLFKYNTFRILCGNGLKLLFRLYMKT